MRASKVLQRCQKGVEGVEEADPDVLQLAKRRDLRKHRIFSIDPPTAR